MTNGERKVLIENAMRDYRMAKASGKSDRIRRAVNDMENVYIAVGLYAVEGTENLRKAILENY